MFHPAVVDGAQPAGRSRIELDSLTVHIGRVELAGGGSPGDSPVVANDDVGDAGKADADDIDVRGRCCQLHLVPRGRRAERQVRIARKQRSARHTQPVRHDPPVAAAVSLVALTLREPGFSAQTLQQLVRQPQRCRVEVARLHGGGLAVELGAGARVRASPAAHPEPSPPDRTARSDPCHRRTAPSRRNPDVCLPLDTPETSSSARCRRKATRRMRWTR